MTDGENTLNVLYIGVNYQYMNPTPVLLPAALGRHCNVYPFGPGFNVQSVLDAGVDAFAQALGSIDIIVTTKDFAGPYPAENLNRMLSVFAGFRPMTQEFVDGVRGFLMRNHGRVVASMLDSDVYAIHQDTLDAFMRHAGYFIGPREGCFDLETNDVHQEKYINRKQNLTLGLYDSFAKATRERRINVLQILAESEFTWNPLAARSYDVSVPGSHYARRASIYRSLKSHKGFALSKRSYEYVFKLANKVGLKPFQNVYAMSLYQLAFRELLRNSRICVTDGGLINFTIRKYFEIPASGALLLCWPTTDFEEIGFRHGVNCLSVGSTEDVIEQVRAVAANPDAFQAIADAGQRLVLEKHALGARASQLHRAFRKIVDGTFRGSHWESGDFVLH